VSENTEGPLPERPLLAPWLRRATSADGSLLLEYGDEIVAVAGDPAALDHLDDDLVRLLRPEGVVVDGPPVADEEALREAALGCVPPSLAAHRLSRARVTLVGSGPLAEEVARLLPGRLRRIDWDEPPRAELAVVAPSAAELPELAAWNERRVGDGTTWLLVLPFNGRFATIGPLFVPGETCCHRCFVLRRASTLPDSADFLALDLVRAAYPLGRSLAAALGGLASALASRWIARRDGAIAGAFFALELDDGLRLTRHRVLRVPRCDACSPARGEPSPVPWASGVRR
jgi:bacteriocin biosynthesis cyclodehydratase domain-containing protein